MAYRMAEKPPDWINIMKDCGGADAEDNGYVIITRGTAKLAKSALRTQNASEAYHNYMAAEKELTDLLEGK